MMTPLENAQLSLEGLSVGDAFGEQFFSLLARFLTDRQLPPGSWRWTDDTHMALSIVEVLASYRYIQQDALAKAFAGRFLQEPYRGYAGGASHLLKRISHGEDWRTVSPSLFNGGSYGNGGAMRAAPIGGFFAGDPERAAQEAKNSAVITHAHPEGQAGAMAVAAALTTVSPLPTGKEFLRQVCLWIAAYHLDNFEEALWQTARGMGDVDTTCAIVGGIVALSSRHVPTAWAERREPLPIG